MIGLKQRPAWGPGWTREQWREHCRIWSEKYKRIHAQKPPSRRGEKHCPRCDQMQSRKDFALALRQPDGLRQYCNDCNREGVRVWYWTSRLQTVRTKDALMQSLEQALHRFPMRDLRKMAAGTRWEGKF